MPSPVSDEAFARYVNQIGNATFEQIEAAKAVQAENAAKGVTLSLGEVLVQQGILTAAMRENVEKKLQAQATGGIQQLGNYKLLKKLGEGGMGAVYLAEDTMLARKVAVKVLPKRFTENPEFLARFRREARAAGRLNHPNIVGAFAVDEEHGHHYYVMEYCEGEPLDALLKRQKVLPENQVIEVAIQVAQGLGYAHGHNFIHRDIKPGNIFLTREGVAKILDLGLSKNVADAEQSFQTVSGTALGTPHYISPEQAQGARNVDGRTDVYSLGATLYHLLTGQTPFTASTAAAIMLKHISEQLPDPRDVRPDLSEGIVHIICKAMAKAPGDRYANMGELLLDLEQVKGGQAPSSAALDAGLSSIAMRRTATLPPPPQARATAGLPSSVPGRGAGVAQAPARPLPHAGEGRDERRRVRGEGAGAPQAPALPASPSKKLYYIIGGGVSAVVVLGVILAFALSGDSKPEGTAGRTPPPPPAVSAPKPSPDVEKKIEPKGPEPKTAEPKVPALEPKAPEEYDPRATVAASLLEQAKAYLRAHPDDPASYRDKLQTLMKGYARTPAAEEAARLVAGLKIPEKPTVGDLPRSEALLRPNETVADYAKRMNLAPETSLDLGGVKMDMVLVPAGELDMGSNDGGPEEKPVHKVRISKPFYIAKCETTVAQFRAFADATKYQTECEKGGNKGWTVKDGKWQGDLGGINWRQPGFEQTPDHPAVLVSWNDAQAFCAWLSQQSGRDVRLPTEAQWEYAARGPQSQKYPWGDKWDGTKANHGDTSLKNTGFIMWGCTGDNDGFAYTSPVGIYKTGASWCGAFDMAGNVWEWVQDKWNDKYYAQSPDTDPQGPTDGNIRVRRGGSWSYFPNICRSAHRNRDAEQHRNTDIGFRLALEVPPRPAASVAVQPRVGELSAVLPRSDALLRPNETVADYAKRMNLAAETALDLGGGVKMEMVLVPAGEFDMGSNDGPADEKPAHRVRISKPFYIGKYEVTVAQFRAFADSAKYVTGAEKANRGWSVKDGKFQEMNGITWRTPGFKQDDNHPICKVWWGEAEEFCRWASKKTGRNVGLATEAQWEFAARGPQCLKYPWGDKWDGTKANHADVTWRNSDAVVQGRASSNDEDGFAWTAPVGSYKNGASWCGAYDMAGNVWEWVEDLYHNKYYLDSPPGDPKGPSTGMDHVLRGGNWDGPPRSCSATHRESDGPGRRFAFWGFRCVLNVPASAAPVGVQPAAGNLTPVLPPLPPSDALLRPNERVADYAKRMNLAPETSLDLGGGVNMEMVLVPAGEFDMGSNDGGPEEKPVHKVRISRPFYIGKYDVTVAQFRAFAEVTKHLTEAEKGGGGWTVKDGKWQPVKGVNWRNPGFTQDDNHPVVIVTWNDAQDFCKWATKLAARTVRLPTEAEWEYAARGPKNPKYPWGDKWEGNLANVADASMRRVGFGGLGGEIKEDDGYPFTSPGGAFKNASWCGAFDMAGNVWQWCQDNGSDRYYADSPAVDPPGPATGEERVFRGGCWAYGPDRCRSARRERFRPWEPDSIFGFRVVLDVPAGATPVGVQPGAGNLTPAPAPASDVLLRPNETVAGYAKRMNLAAENSLDLGGGVRMAMVLVPAGEFDMGSNDGPPEEKPVHKVKISKPFYIGKYEATVAQFRCFAETSKYQTDCEKFGNKGWGWGGKDATELSNVNWKQPTFPQEDNHPVCLVSGNDAQAFIAWAAKATSRKVRLPTEAEWEYACRANTTTRFYAGQEDKDLDKAGWFSANSGQKTHPVGQRAANAWGLYDMHGNVWEWCEDRAQKDYYKDSPRADPQGPVVGDGRVLRGGSWINEARSCRSAQRFWFHPHYRTPDNGFRCAMDAAGTTTAPGIQATKP